MPIDNEERAHHAAKALAMYLGSKGEYDSDRPLEALIDEHEPADLICDLLHLCDRLGFDAELQIGRALMHYTAERDEGA